MLAQLPAVDEMYNALVRRDANYEGVLFAAITTTGVFCRPVCPARKSKREHVEFFSNAAAALHAGYRPCKRCRPLETASAPLVQQLVEAVETEPDVKWTSADLLARGIDPDTARRHFQKHFGLTFAGYARSRRMGEALASIRTGRSVTDAQLDAGFSSASGFRDAFHRLFGTAPRHGHTAAVLRGSWIESPLGAMLAIADDTALHLLEFVERRGLSKEIERLRKRRAAVVVPGRTPPIDRIEAELDAYFSGRDLIFRTPITRQATPFQEAVWDTLVAIPAGETRSYAQIAAATGKPAAVRAVAQANGANPLALIVPCHRVIGSDGSLTGYGGGRWRKRWLIDHEQRTVRAGDGGGNGEATKTTRVAGNAAGSSTCRDRGAAA